MTDRRLLDAAKEVLEANWVGSSTVPGTPTLVPGALVIAVGALVALVASLLIARSGLPLDDPLWTGLAIVAGVVIGSIVAWRAGGVRGSIATTDDAG